MRFRRDFCTTVAALLLISISCPAQPEMLTITDYTGRIEVPASSDHVPLTGITVEAWTFYDPAMPGGSSHPTIVRKNAGSWSYILRQQTSAINEMDWFLRTATGTEVLSSSILAPHLTWLHVAATYDNQFARLYFDGVQVAEGFVTGGPLADTGGSLMLAQGQGYSETWRGHLDEVRIWSTARTAAEIQETMHLQVGSAPGLVSSWQFEGNYEDSAGVHDGAPLGGVSVILSTAPLLATALYAPPTSPLGAPLVYAILTPEALQPYAFDVSLVGNAPGLTLPAPLTGHLPLEPPFLNLELGPFVPGVFVDFWGISDAARQAHPTFMVPAAPQFSGIQIYAAFLTLDALGPQGIGSASNGTQTTLVGTPSP